MRRTTRRLLLVEDNDVDAMVVREILGRAEGPELEILRAGSLAEALAEARGRLPEVILLDLGLPDAQGLEGLRALIDAFAEAPVVILTGADDLDLAIQGVREGAQDYLFKAELRADLLTRSLRYAVERAAIQNELRRTIGQLERAMAQLETLSGLLPICSNCKAIRDDEGIWSQIESYIETRSTARFTHSLCPICKQALYPGLFDGHERE